jgi:hypothetical protein
MGRTCRFASIKQKKSAKKRGKIEKSVILKGSPYLSTLNKDKHALTTACYLILPFMRTIDRGR